MARVRLKGINSKTKRLADGTSKTYWYAFKGGPRLPGKPGDAEFMAAYNEAVTAKRPAPAGVMLSVLSGYQQSDDFRQLAARTRADYVKQIKKIEAEFIDFPLSALDDRRTRAIFLEWRDRMALQSRRQADYAWSVLARVLSWAHDRGLVVANPCTRGGRLYRGSRAENVWSVDDEAQFMNLAPAHLRLAFMLALWTGQRQGDLLALTWASYDGEKIRLRQQKTGTRVVIPVGAPLKKLLDTTERRSPIVLVTLDGKPWTPDGFRVSWRKAVAKAGITGLTFNDLRGTAVTRLALAGCTEAQIATLTGHSLRDARSILDANYLARDPALAESAIRKLETRTKIPD